LEFTLDYRKTKEEQKQAAAVNLVSWLRCDVDAIFFLRRRREAVVKPMVTRPTEWTSSTSILDLRPTPALDFFF
jgi:hypothetical protein